MYMQAVWAAVQRQIGTDSSLVHGNVTGHGDVNVIVNPRVVKRRSPSGLLKISDDHNTVRRFSLTPDKGFHRIVGSNPHFRHIRRTRRRLKDPIAS